MPKEPGLKESSDLLPTPRRCARKLALRLFQMVARQSLFSNSCREQSLPLVAKETAI